MAIAIQQEFNTAMEKYDRVLDRLRLNGRTAKGESFFVCGESSNGVRALAVWESRAAYDAFFKEKLETALEAEGVAPPKITTWPVHRASSPTGPALTSTPRERMTH